MPAQQTQVHVIVDDSGSMYDNIITLRPIFNPEYSGMKDPFVDTIRKELDALADRLESPCLSFVFHIFSDTAVTGYRLSHLPELKRSTNISAGFNAMLDSLHGGPRCDHCIVIFVSDGADGHFTEQRAALPPVPCARCTLLTVAVGADFPTTLVVNELRPKYHTFGGDAVPFVFPLTLEHDTVEQAKAEIEWVASQLEEIIRMGGEMPELTLEEMRGGCDIECVIRQCRRWYNACTIKCLSLDISLQDKIELVKTTREDMGRAELLLQGMMEHLVKPLPRNLRARRSLFQLCSLREKLNNLLGQLNKGRLFEDLSDQEKQEYLSFGNISGRFLTTAMRYRAANFETTRKSLLRLVSEYAPTPQDEGLMDQIGLCSQAEYFADAASVMHDIENTFTLGGIMELVPFVGRIVELHPVPECSQINPWVVSVKSLSTTVKRTSTHNLYVQCKGTLELREATFNSLIVLGGHAECPGIFCHLQSFALTRNWMLYFNDARLASAAMLLVHVMGGETLEEWKREELDIVRSICAQHTETNSHWWHEYLACLRCDADFRRCLVTESPKLPKALRCPGLSKYLLGVWWLSDRWGCLSELQLHSRFQAAVVEHMGRCQLKPEAYISLKQGDAAPMTKTMVLDIVLDHVVPAQRTSHITERGISRLIEAALQPHIQAARQRAREGAGIAFDRERLYHDATYSHLSLLNIQRVFEHLFEQIGGFKWWDGPTDDELMIALLSSRGSSQDRNLGVCGLSKDGFLTHEQLVKTLVSQLEAKADPAPVIMVAARGTMKEYLHMRHMGLPRPIPASLARRYMEETGRDVDATWQVDPETRLSRFACCFTSCDLYLTIPPGEERRKRATIRDHLRMCCRLPIIPGLHRCVARNASLPTLEIIRAVAAGSELGDPFQSREALRRIEKGMGHTDGVPRSFSSVDHYAGCRAEQARSLLLERVKRAMRIHAKDEPIVLHHIVEDIKISLEENTWSYEEFKRVFDAKYAAMGV